MWRDYLTIKLVNIVFFLWFTALDFFIFSLAWGIKESNPQKYGYGIGKEVYLTPSTWIFGILFVVHLLLAANVLYVQWTVRGKEMIIEKMTFRFSALMLLSIIWGALWVRKIYIVSFIFSIFLAGLASNVYVTLKMGHRFNAESDLFEYGFVHLPFSLFHGWTMFLLVLNGFVAFAPTSSHAGTVAKVFAVWGLALLAGLAVTYAVSVREGDVIGATVISLALFAIFTHQKDPWIHWFALGFAIVASLATLKSLIYSYRARRGGEITLDSVGGVPGVTPQTTV